MKNRVFTFIKDKIGHECTDIDELIYKTGMDGLDADTFMACFSKEFEVDMSKFDFYRYFQDETLSTSISDIRKYWNVNTDFSIGHLIEVAERKEWFDPEEDMKSIKIRKKKQLRRMITIVLVVVFIVVYIVF